MRSPLTMGRLYNGGTNSERCRHEDAGRQEETDVEGCGSPVGWVDGPGVLYCVLGAAAGGDERFWPGRWQRGVTVRADRGDWCRGSWLDRGGVHPQDPGGRIALRLRHRRTRYQ